MFRSVCSSLFCCFSRSPSYSSLNVSSSPPNSPVSVNLSAPVDSPALSSETSDLLDEFRLSANETEGMTEEQAEKFYKSQVEAGDGEVLVELTLTHFKKKPAQVKRVLSDLPLVELSDLSGESVHSQKAGKLPKRKLTNVENENSFRLEFKFAPNNQTATGGNNAVTNAQTSFNAEQNESEQSNNEEILKMKEIIQDEITCLPSNYMNSVIPRDTKYPNSTGSTRNSNSDSTSLVSPSRGSGSGSGSFTSPRSPASLPHRSSGEKKTQENHSNKKSATQHLSALSLPSGSINRLGLEEFISKLDSSSLSYRGIFAFLYSASHRSLSGEVLKSFLKPVLERFQSRQQERKLGKYPLKGREHEVDDDLPEVIFDFLQFVWKFIKQLRIDRKSRTLHVSFQFPSSNSQLLELNTPLTWVLPSKHPTDQFLVCAANTPVLSTVETRRLIFKNEIEFQLAPPNGASPAGSIVSVRDGDIQIKKYLSFNAGVRYEHKPNLADFDSENRTYLECNRAGKPIVRNNHYVPKTYDDWLVVTVLKQEVLIGLPRFSG
jgi:hypothetical protein